MKSAGQFRRKAKNRIWNCKALAVFSLKSGITLLTKCNELITIKSNRFITFRKEEITLIWNRIKVLRAERDWTQADLADRVGISRQAVISIEKYKYTPSLELAFKIAEVFGVSIDEVFEHREDK